MHDGRSRQGCAGQWRLTLLLCGRRGAHRWSCMSKPPIYPAQLNPSVKYHRRLQDRIECRGPVAAMRPSNVTLLTAPLLACWMMEWPPPRSDPNEDWAGPPHEEGKQRRLGSSSLFLLKKKWRCGAGRQRQHIQPHALRVCPCCPTHRQVPPRFQPAMLCAHSLHTHTHTQSTLGSPFRRCIEED